MVYHSDDYLQLRGVNQVRAWTSQEAGARRFFALAARLPMDLQMVLCNRTCCLARSTILTRDTELGLKKFAREFGEA